MPRTLICVTWRIRTRSLATRVLVYRAIMAKSRGTRACPSDLVQVCILCLCLCCYRGLHLPSPFNFVVVIFCNTRRPDLGALPRVNSLYTLFQCIVSMQSVRTSSHVVRQKLAALPPTNSARSVQLVTSYSTVQRISVLCPPGKPLRYRLPDSR